MSEPTYTPKTSRHSGTHYDIKSFELVRQFVEGLLVQKTSTSGTDDLRRNVVDWETLEASVADSNSLEQAIGRAITLVNQDPGGLLTCPSRVMPGAEDSDSFFSFSLGDVAADFGDGTRYRTRVARRVTTIVARRRLVATVVSLFLVLLSVTIFQVGQRGPSASASYKAQKVRVLTGNAQLASDAVSPSVSLSLPASAAPPAASPPSLADAPPLRSHEVFGFAPYWTLDQSSGFNVSQLSTIAYFSLDVNPDGTLDESGPGWNGYQSQDLSNLVTRAHAAGDRVVLTVTCFDQSSLDSLTSSANAPPTLAAGLISVIEAKNLDGVNLDFEGTGDSDQAGLTKLVTEVSNAIHGANPHYQVTMDTYASSAGDPSGFYDIPALAPAVDAFFVMQYQLNLNASSSANSPLTSSMFSDQTTIDQYLAAVPASKIILGLPYFGIDWPTTDGTLTARAAGPATTPSDAQIVSSGHPVYWDPTTSTAWTSYQVGTQWHETFFEDPTSLYDVAQAASSSDLAGLGIWALGMDGNNPSMLSALLGFAPAVKDSGVGPSTTTQPASTSTSTTTSSTSSPTSTTSSTTTSAPPTTITSETTSTAPSSTSTSSTSSTTTTSQPAPSYQYSGDRSGQNVTLTPWSGSAPPETSATIGQLTGFATNSPTMACLMNESDLNVEPVPGHSNEYLVVATTPADCVNADFTFSVSA